MRNRADGTRKITRVPRGTQRAERETCGTQIERVHLVQVRTDCKKVHTGEAYTSCNVKSRLPLLNVCSSS